MPTPAGRFDRPYGARLLGRAVEDPGVLDRLRGAGIHPVDLGAGELQAAYALLCHLADAGRLTSPTQPGLPGRQRAAAANLHAVRDWTVDQRRRRAAVRRDAGPIRTGRAVPGDRDLLLAAAARLEITWWFGLWEQGWPPAPELGSDVEALRRQRILDALGALGGRVTQRATAGRVDPGEIADDLLAELARIDPAAVARHTADRFPGPNPSGWEQPSCRGRGTASRGRRL